jgi:ankyrin repeat protein
MVKKLSSKLSLDQWTALHTAATAGSSDTILKLLVDTGFKVNGKSTTGMTPLRVALDSHHVPAAEALLELGGRL